MTFPFTHALYKDLRSITELAGPTFFVLLIQTAVGIAETFYFSFLGVNVLAGGALVFPLLTFVMVVR